ncbi:MAG: hypothetical protein ACI38Q_00135 [Candidatus Bruticola sp.]
MMGGCKLALSLVWSVGLWLTIFLFAFLLLPVISAFPLWWGAVCALIVFFLQIIWGPSLLRLLLGVKNNDDTVCFVPGECPFVFLLDNQFIASEGSRTFLQSAQLDPELILRHTWSRSANRIYSALLALPCLLRAFEAFTSDYGRLHFAQGPLWHLGRGFGWLAVWLEKPLRWARPKLCLENEDSLAVIEAAFSIPLGRALRVPAWMENLDILSIVNFKQAKREAAWFWAGGQGQAPAEIAPLVGNWFPWLLFAVMSFWAVWGGGLWGAPVLFLGLGFIVKINSEYDRANPGCSVTLSADKQHCKYGPLLLKGIARRQDTPGLDDTWLELYDETQVHNIKKEITDVGEGAEGDNKSVFREAPSRLLVRLESFVGWQADEGSSVECSGWLNSENLAVCVAELRCNERTYRYYPRLWRLLLPWFFVGSGIIWSILQKIGL